MVWKNYQSLKCLKIKTISNKFLKILRKFRVNLINKLYHSLWKFWTVQVYFIVNKVNGCFSEKIMIKVQTKFEIFIVNFESFK